MEKFVFGDGYVFRPLSMDEVAAQEKIAYDLIYEELDKHKVPRSQYSLGAADGSNDGCVCFHAEGGMWVYYVSERGGRYGVAIFSALSDGLNFFVWSFLSSPKKRNADVGFLPYVGPN